MATASSIYFYITGNYTTGLCQAVNLLWRGGAKLSRLTSRLTKTEPLSRQKKGPVLRGPILCTVHCLHRHSNLGGYYLDLAEVVTRLRTIVTTSGDNVHIDASCFSRREASRSFNQIL